MDTAQTRPVALGHKPWVLNQSSLFPTKALLASRNAQDICPTAHLIRVSCNRNGGKHPSGHTGPALPAAKNLHQKRVAMGLIGRHLQNSGLRSSCQHLLLLQLPRSSPFTCFFLKSLLSPIPCTGLQLQWVYQVLGPLWAHLPGPLSLPASTHVSPSWESILEPMS